MLKLILGTGNDNKVRELQALLGDTAVVLKSDAQPDVDEHGATCAANAVIKAQEYFKAQTTSDFDYIVADDSGIFVPFLGDNIPGVKSARFSYFDIKSKKLVPHNQELSGNDVDRLNNERLLRYLENEPTENRRAYFYSGLALLDSKGEFMDLFEGLTFGTVDTEIKDTSGWGYDHVFIADSGNHWGVIAEEAKNKESHRYKASLGLVEYFQRSTKPPSLTE